MYVCGCTSTCLSLPDAAEVEVTFMPGLREAGEAMAQRAEAVRNGEIQEKTAWEVCFQC